MTNFVDKDHWAGPGGKGANMELAVEVRGTFAVGGAYKGSSEMAVKNAWTDGEMGVGREHAAECGGADEDEAEDEADDEAEADDWDEDGSSGS